ncbi:MAG: hypothetical protein HPY58_04985 [Firmicutes bacterium]|nr:hypothetical protein [Bacillota bacterium]
MSQKESSIFLILKKLAKVELHFSRFPKKPPDSEPRGFSTSHGAKNTISFPTATILEPGFQPRGQKIRQQAAGRTNRALPPAKYNPSTIPLRSTQFFDLSSF